LTPRDFDTIAEEAPDTLDETMARAAPKSGMDQIRIRGGRKLAGTIPISGAKNAALPLMAAS
jgi:hypothetical protein